MKKLEYNWEFKVIKNSFIEIKEILIVENSFEFIEPKFTNYQI